MDIKTRRLTQGSQIWLENWTWNFCGERKSVQCLPVFPRSLGKHNSGGNGIFLEEIWYRVNMDSSKVIINWVNRQQKSPAICGLWIITERDKRNSSKKLLHIISKYGKKIWYEHMSAYLYFVTLLYHQISTL